MFAFEPIDPALLVSEPPPTAPLVVEVPFCATPSLGRKQCAVRWVPQADALAIAGSWDEPENELTAWRVRLDSVATDDARAMDDDAEERGPQTTRLGSTPHDGCVLGLAVAESGGLAFTASGAGGVSCYAIADADESVAGGKVKMDNLWSRRGAPEDRLATLGVACNGDKVAAVGEDGGLVVLKAERGGDEWRTQSREPALYAVAWWGANILAVGGTVVSFWDVRASGGKKPVLTLAPSPGAQMHLGAPLLCVSPEAPHEPRRLAAGATDGTVSVWDVRAPPTLLSRFVAHRSDVWDVQLLGSGGSGGEPGLTLLSCGSDGCLYEWALDKPPALLPLDVPEPSTTPLGCAPPPERRALVQLALPINSLERSPQGMLAAASDAQVLTFVDIR